MWAVVIHFLEAKNFVFVMFLWLGFFPNVCQDEKSFLCFPTIYRRDHILLGVVVDSVFGHVRAETSLGYDLL